MRATAPRASKLAVAALAAATAGSVLLLFLPVYTESTNNGPEHGATLIETQGAGVAALLALPVAVIAVPLLVAERHRRSALRIVAALVLAFALVTGFSIGEFYLPAAILLVLAARAARR
jgi:lipopolysaccharide export LptBFGC system permease protein LptF